MKVSKHWMNMIATLALVAGCDVVDDREVTVPPTPKPVAEPVAEPVAAPPTTFSDNPDAGPIASRDNRL